jgi:hypothetical protein
MKYILLSLLFLSLCNKSDAQFIGGDFGYRKIEKFDTVKAIILLTECDSCTSKSVPGFAVRQLFVYHGDRMPPGNYSDQWEIIAVLNWGKKRFSPNNIIWNYKIKQ